MEITKPRHLDRTPPTTTPASVPKESESSRFLQWLLFKPQLHAVLPFEANTATRADNTTRDGPRRTG